MQTPRRSFSEWFEPRRRIAKWIAAGWSSFAVCALIAWKLWPRGEEIAAAVDRLIFAAQLCAAPGLLMLAMMQTLWRGFDEDGADDPWANAESRRFLVNQRVLTNTIEQTAIFVPIFVALSVRVAPPEVFVLPYLMTLWCMGRLLFWLGYNIGNDQRAIGMDWTVGAAALTAVLFARTFV